MSLASEALRWPQFSFLIVNGVWAERRSGARPLRLCAAAVAVTMSFMSHPREFHLYLGSHDAMQADLLTCK